MGARCVALAVAQPLACYAGSPQPSAPLQVFPCPAQTARKGGGRYIIVLRDISLNRTPASPRAARNTLQVLAIFL